MSFHDRWLLAASVLIAGHAADAQPTRTEGLRTTVVRGVRVFDGVRSTTLTDVLLRAGRVAAVGPRVAAPVEATVVDGAGRTLLPGLVDAYVADASPGSLRRAIVFGVTAVVAADPDSSRPPSGCSTDVSRMSAPRALPCADVIAVGRDEQEDPTVAPYGPEAGPRPGRVDARGRRSLVAVAVPPAPDDSGSPLASVRAMVVAAHRRGQKVVARAASLWAARAAVATGVDGLAGLFTDAFPDSGFAHTLARRGIFVASGLSRLTGADGAAPAPDLAADPNVRPYLRIADSIALLRPAAAPDVPGRPYAAAQQTVRELHRVGVTILAGSGAGRAGLVPGASLHGELARLVEAGLSPSEALSSATAVPAAALGLADRGRILPGYRADLVLVNGDPTVDIRATRAIVEVWKGGEPVRRDVDRTAVEADKLAFIRALDEPAPRDLGGGAVSDFDGGDLHTAFGSGWVPSTDEIVGGHSTVHLTPVAPGRGDRGGALRLAGTVAGGAVRWAGALFLPGPFPGGTANLSGRSAVTLWARGDGRPCQVVLYTRSRGTAAPTIVFTPGPTWTRYRFPFARFDGIDARDLQGVLVAAGDTPGPFAFEIDDVSIE